MLIQTYSIANAHNTSNDQMTFPHTVLVVHQTQTRYGWYKDVDVTVHLDTQFSSAHPPHLKNHSNHVMQLCVLVDQINFLRGSMVSDENTRGVILLYDQLSAFLEIWIAHPVLCLSFMSQTYPITDGPIFTTEYLFYCYYLQYLLYYQRRSLKKIQHKQPTVLRPQLP